MTKSHYKNSQIHLYCIAVLQWQRSLTDILKREAAGENALSRIWFKCEFTHFFTPTVWQQPSVCHRKGRGPPQWPKTYAIRTSFDFLHGNQCLFLVIQIKKNVNQLCWNILSAISCEIRRQVACYNKSCPQNPLDPREQGVARCTAVQQLALVIV